MVFAVAFHRSRGGRFIRRRISIPGACRSSFSPFTFRIRRLTMNRPFFKKRRLDWPVSHVVDVSLRRHAVHSETCQTTHACNADPEAFSRVSFNEFGRKGLHLEEEI